MDTMHELNRHKFEGFYNAKHQPQQNISESAPCLFCYDSHHRWMVSSIHVHIRVAFDG